jgi:hypothetical protein
MKLRLCSPILIGALVIAGCSDNSSTQSPTSPEALIGPLCQVGCTDTDPNPSAPGVFLGSGVTPVVCLSGTDSDLDGLNDFCENYLALAFAPELAYNHFDNVGREPHWVARPLDDGLVRIGYLLSYHVDLGTQDPYTCMNFLPASWCWGHAGDSEDIFLDVLYNFSTHHWVLQTAYYSRHGDNGVYGPGSHGYPQAVFYPSHPGAYPRSFVSMYKHANYASQPECDAAQYGFEDCLPDTYVRVATALSLNLGSRSHQRLNCMSSSDPLYSGDGRSECYWTGTDFAGWQTFQPRTDPYSPKLAYFGF